MNQLIRANLRRLGWITVGWTTAFSMFYLFWLLMAMIAIVLLSFVTWNSNVASIDTILMAFRIVILLAAISATVVIHRVIKDDSKIKDNKNEPVSTT